MTFRSARGDTVTNISCLGTFNTFFKMPDCWATSQSGTRMKINVNTKTNQVPDWDEDDGIWFRRYRPRCPAMITSIIHVFFNDLGFKTRLNMQFCAKGSTNLIVFYHYICISDNHVGFYDLFNLCPTLHMFCPVSSVYLVQYEYEILREAKVKINKYKLIIFLSRSLNIHPISHPKYTCFCCSWTCCP